MPKLPSLAVLLTLVASTITASPAAAQDRGPAGTQAYWQGVATTVSAAVAEVETRFAAGDAKAARSALTGAYFARFEDSKMEAAIRKEIGQSRAIEVEGLFGALRKAIKAGDGAEVTRLASNLKEALAVDGAALDAAGVPADVFAVNQ